jgi:hypothetical protein
MGTSFAWYVSSQHSPFFSATGLNVIDWSVDDPDVAGQCRHPVGKARNSNGCHILKKKYEAESSVGIAAGYGLDDPRIESRWGRDFPHLSRPALGLTQPALQWVFPGGRKRPGRDADPSPPSSAEV